MQQLRCLPVVARLGEFRDELGNGGDIGDEPVAGGLAESPIRVEELAFSAEGVDED